MSVRSKGPFDHLPDPGIRPPPPLASPVPTQVGGVEPVISPPVPSYLRSAVGVESFVPAQTRVPVFMFPANGRVGDVFELAAPAQADHQLTDYLWESFHRHEEIEPLAGRPSVQGFREYALPDTLTGDELTAFVQDHSVYYRLRALGMPDEWFLHLISE